MAELVARTAAAVAVDENLTTLIDWTNIETLSDFTIIINNASGGSANDLADIQIDTSDDGGITVATDQHADTPAVPIAAGAAASGAFTETAKFIRIRALAAAGEDTTAEAYLLADTVTGRLATLADIRSRLHIADGDTDYDATINRLIAGVSTLFETYCHRPLLANAADITEYYTGRGPYLQLRRWPVIAITSIKESVDYDFDNVTALTADTDYRLVEAGRAGLLYRIGDNWYDVVDATAIIYRGGYCAAGQTPGTGETALPADLREAAIEQTSFLFQRRDDIGLSGVSYEGGSLSRFSAIKLLPQVEMILTKYKAISL